MSDFLALAAVCDDDLFCGPAALGSTGLNLLDYVHALDNLSEDYVFAIQPLGLGGAEEELGPVGVGPGVGHREHTGSGVLEGEVLVLKLVAVDGLAPSAVSCGEVATLAHEVGDHPVEGGALEAEALLAGAEGAEALRRLGHHVGTQLEQVILKYSF